MLVYPFPLFVSALVSLFHDGRLVRFARKSSKGPSAKSIAAMFTKYAELGDSPGKEGPSMAVTPSPSLLLSISFPSPSPVLALLHHIRVEYF